jgi:6-phosphogluconolactonase (cycloisomerase 2 family)
MCLDPDSRLLFVADSGMNRIAVFTVATGNLVRYISMQSQLIRPMRKPRSVAWLSPQQLLICDNQYVQIIDSQSGECIREFDGSSSSSSSSSSSTSGLDNIYCAVDVDLDNDRIYSLDRLQCCIRVFQLSSGDLIGTRGRIGRGPGAMMHPSSMCLSPDKRHLIIANTYAYRMKIFDVVTWKGRDFSCGGGRPTSVTVTPQATLLVITTQNIVALRAIPPISALTVSTVSTVSTQHTPNVS